MSTWFIDSEQSTCFLVQHYLQSQPKHPCLKKLRQEFKKGQAEKDVKSKWAAKASC